MTTTTYHKIQELAERGATEGERAAAKAAMERMKARYGDLLPEQEPEIDLELSYSAKWERYLALSIIEHFGLTGYKVPDRTGRRWMRKVQIEAPESLAGLISELYTLHREKLKERILYFTHGYCHEVFPSQRPRKERDDDDTVQALDQELIDVALVGRFSGVKNQNAHRRQLNGKN